jgi:hypothetical protein
MEIDGEYVLCPYCQNKCGDWEDFVETCTDDSVDFECEECHKKFVGKRVVTVDYRTEMDCSLNDEKHEKGKYHCKKCDQYGV